MKSENLDQVIAEREEFSGFSPIRRSTRTFTTNVTIEENIQDDEIIDINEKYRELYENLLNNNKSVSKLEKSSMRSMILSFHLSRMLKNPLHIQSNQIISTITIESYIEKYGTLLRVMETGEAVGEKALMEGKPRTATMFTITKCWFLILQKEDLKTVRNQFSKIAKERSDFLRNVFGLKPNAFTSKVEENMLYSFTVIYICQFIYFFISLKNMKKITYLLNKDHLMRKFL